MKQKGTDWITADGKTTLAKFVPKHDALFEKLGQKIAAEAVVLERELRQAKVRFIDLCKEALRAAHDQQAKNRLARFTFYTFDREYKIEYDVKDEYVRVYRANKINPGHKDYEAILLDLNKTAILTPSTPVEIKLDPQQTPPQDLFAHDNFGNNQKP